VIFGGNGSRFLDWLSGFRPFARSRPAENFFVPLFREIFEAGLGSDVSPRFEVGVSEHPKQEVALGLLTEEAAHILGSADGRTGGARTATDDDPGSIRMLVPVGEVVRFPSRSDPLRPEERVTLSGPSGILFDFGTEFPGSMIRRYHDTLLEGLGRPEAPHRDWAGMRDRLTDILRECDRGFYLPRVREELERRLRGNVRLHPSIFAIEVSLTLRKLQTELFSEPQDADR
jgi:hypothetical protein